MMIDKTVCELFAGVGGFRCGLNNIRTLSDASKPEKWKTAWFNQWEPADKKIQWAYGCYVDKFGDGGLAQTNTNISLVNKATVPDFNLLVGGFPCQNYSVAATLAQSKGITGEKGILWFDIYDLLVVKRPPFILLENVDRLLKSPAAQRGRDFGIILASLRDLGYMVEWRVINAADYGYQQRRKRVFIFAYRNDTRFAAGFKDSLDVICNGFFAQTFRFHGSGDGLKTVLPNKTGDAFGFSFDFRNCGVMMSDGSIHTYKVSREWSNADPHPPITLGDILEDEADECFFIPEDRLYYTSPDVNRCDETAGRLPEAARKTWQYIKGAKKIPRVSADGHEWIYSEGAMPMIDEWDKPARTILTSEGSFNRSTHIVRDKKSGRIRLLTLVELERIQGFPDDWTRKCLWDGYIIDIPLSKRRLMMGNALVVDLIRRMEPKLAEIFENE